MPSGNKPLHEPIMTCMPEMYCKLPSMFKVDLCVAHMKVTQCKWAYRKSLRVCLWTQITWLMQSAASRDPREISANWVIQVWASTVVYLHQLNSGLNQHRIPSSTPWNPRVVMMPTLSSLTTPEVVLISCLWQSSLRPICVFDTVYPRTLPLYNSTASSCWRHM